MKVLIVAPKICTPWTEGRKKFVCDLVDQASNRWDLHGLTTLDPDEKTNLPTSFDTYEVSSPRDHLLIPVGSLSKKLTDINPDLVCYFPFGAFHGIRGIANLWSIWRFSRICRKHGIPAITLMYSLTMEANSLFHRLFLKNVYFNQHTGKTRGIRFGVKFPQQETIIGTENSGKNLLFMAGTSAFNAERLEYVLDVRGLRILFQAGKALSTMGYRLIVAVPFLSNPDTAKFLRNLPDNTWPDDSLELKGEVSIPSIYEYCQAFVFPYGQEEKQFVPTSVVEAMHYRIPVILPNLDFLSPFYKSRPLALMYDNGSLDSLIQCINRLDQTPEIVNEITRQAAGFVDTEYDIAQTVIDIEKEWSLLKSAD